VPSETGKRGELCIRGAEIPIDWLRASLAIEENNEMIAAARTPYQDLCERLLLELLNSCVAETLSQAPFKVTAKSLIRHYPGFNMDNEELYKAYALYKMYFRFTKRAWIQYQKEPEKVMYEHIWPIEATFSELLTLKNGFGPVTIEAIHEIMKKTEVMILSDEEATLLNGSANNNYSFGGQMRKGLGMRETGSSIERIAAIRAQIEPSTEANSILVRSS
jgi:hypothetical protein